MMIAIGIAAALGVGAGFWLGFFLAGLMATSAAADRQMEAMRRKYIDDATNWLDRKRAEDALFAIRLSKGGSK